jgi:spore coat polysaccharide biosynthesis predicted glycosyltransferase SpsG
MGVKTGLGHFKRCLALANQFKKVSKNVEFIIADLNYFQTINSTGLSYTLVSQLNNRNYDIIVIDSYRTSIELLAYFKKYCNMLVRIDDAYPEIICDMVSDIIINSNPYADLNDYSGLVKKDCKLFVGLEFIPMDSKFCEIRNRYKVRKDIQTVTITFGGSNNKDLVKYIASMILSHQMFKKVIVLNGISLKGLLNPSKGTQLELLPIVENVYDIFELSDLVVCSSSTTCWQLAAIGVPFIAFQTAANQAVVFRYLRQADLGIALDESSIYDGLLLRSISELDSYKRCKLSKISRNTIDCYGAQRIVSKLINCF